MESEETHLVRGKIVFIILFGCFQLDYLLLLALKQGGTPIIIESMNLWERGRWDYNELSPLNGT